MIFSTSKTNPFISIEIMQLSHGDKKSLIENLPVILLIEKGWVFKISLDDDSYIEKML